MSLAIGRAAYISSPLRLHFPQRQIQNQIPMIHHHRHHAPDEPGPKPNLYPIREGSLVTSDVEIRCIDILIDGKVRAEWDFKKRHLSQIFFYHKEFYDPIDIKYISKPHILSLRITNVNGESIYVPDYNDLWQYGPFMDTFMRHQYNVMGYLSQRLGQDRGYKMSTIIPPNIRKITVYAADSVHGLVFSNEYGQSVTFGNMGGTPHEFELFNNEYLVGFFTRTGSWVDSIQIMTSMRRSHLFGATSGGGSHDLMAPIGCDIVGIHGYIDNTVQSIGIMYAYRDE